MSRTASVGAAPHTLPLHGWHLGALCTLGLFGCDAPLEVATDADALVAAVHTFDQNAASESVCAALAARLVPLAVVFAPAPVFPQAWDCDYTDGEWRLVVAELAAAGDFGYTVRAADSAWWEVSVWRRQHGGTWSVEASIRTHHPDAPEAILPLRVASQGWVRASRRLYQEAARVAMLRADRDLAEASLDQVGSRILADSLLDLAAGRPPRVGPWEHHGDDLSWVPVGGAIAQAGDLGFTYGMQTVRADSVMRSRGYLRIWRAKPDSSWQVVLNVQSRVLSPGSSLPQASGAE